MMKKKGVLILNLGTPNSPSVKDVRVYLREFLNDPRVIDIGRIAQLLLVNLIIVPFRAPKSAKEYKKLFKIGNGKSPLLTYGKNLTQKLEVIGKQDYDIALAMRYGSPSMEEVLAKMRLENYDQLYIFPLYPQYASASSGSTIEKAFKIINKWWVIPEVSVIGQFYDHPSYIQCIVNRASKFKHLSVSSGEHASDRDSTADGDSASDDARAVPDTHSSSDSRSVSAANGERGADGHAPPRVRF